MKPEDATLELQTLEDFHSAAETNARKPVTDADEGYRSKLEKAQKTAQSAGNLKSVLAAKQAVTDLDAGRPPLVSDDSDVAGIQKTYMTQRQKADAESEKALAKADQDYLSSLKKLVVELTKAGHIEQAQQVQAKVDELTATLNPKAAAANAVGGQELEIWKKKALEEFPALKLPNSEHSRAFKALKEKKESLAPGFFTNPQWPYLLAKEACIPFGRGASMPLFPEGAQSFNGKKYFVYEEKCTWTTARDKCIKLRGQLVVIPDEPTQAFVKNLAAGRQLWLGATEKETEVSWFWVDGSEVKYKAFDKRQPNNWKGNENRLNIQSNGFWNDNREDGEGVIIGYICEWQEPATGISPPAK